MASDITENIHSEDSALAEKELRARRVCRELRHALEAEWLAKNPDSATRYSGFDLMVNNAELEFSDEGVMLAKQLLEFKAARSGDDEDAEDINVEGLDVEDTDDQGIKIVLLAYSSPVSGGTLLPCVWFSPFDNRATLTCPEYVPAFFHELVMDSLERHGFMYVPYSPMLWFSS